MAKDMTSIPTWQYFEHFGALDALVVAGDTELAVSALYDSLGFTPVAEPERRRLNAEQRRSFGYAGPSGCAIDE